VVLNLQTCNKCALKDLGQNVRVVSSWYAPLSTLLKTTVVGFRISELQSQLEEALNELEKLRESRHHQLQLVESIVRQRDMFRILLAQTTGAIIPLQGKRHISAPLGKNAIVVCSEFSVVVL